MTKRAIVYARVSTDDQADKGFSLSAQIEAGRKYAEVHGMTVTSELIDDGVSGAMAFSERPAGGTAWTLLRTGKADAFIVQNVDRLSRDVVDLLVTIRELLHAGIEVHCLDLGRVTSEYDIMLVIRGWQGSDERQKIKERTMRGRREKSRQGKVVATGEPPYGYSYLRDDKGQVVNFQIVEEQARVIRLIFELYLKGDSIYKIAKHLTEAGIPSLSKHKRKHPLHIWDRSTIGRLLGATTYKGEWHYTVNGGNERFVISVPAIVSEDVWERAQIQRERNKRKAKRNSKYDYLLSGIIRCGCGFSMCGKTKVEAGKIYCYYYCYETYRRSGSEKHICHEKFVNADALEAATWDAILNAVKNPAKFKEKLLEAQRQELEEQEPKRTELAAVEAMIAEAEAEAIDLEQALRNAGKVVGKVIKDKMAALDERYERLEARKAALETALAQRRLTDETIDGLLQFAVKVEKGIDCATNEIKRRVLDGFGAHVTVKDGQVKLHYVLELPISIELQMPCRLQPEKKIVPEP